jgi:cytochrome P450
MLWGSIKRLFGEGILTEGQVWQASRRTLQPLFTTRRVDTLVDGMADEIARAVDDLPVGPAVDIGAAMSRIVCRTMMRTLFGGRVSVDDALRVVGAQNTIANAIVVRLLVPFVPNAVPMPGDRRFRDAVKEIDDVLLPAVRRARAEPDRGGPDEGDQDSDDVIATLGRAKAEDGGDLDERRVRNDTVAMFATSTEATFGVLTYLWPLLATHPHVEEKLYREIDGVVDNGPIRRAHLAGLTYTRMVLEELLRLYPVAWITPRAAVDADDIDGTRIPRGADVLISPYVTHRMAAVWDRPTEFDPERFSPQRIERRHRYAHHPFGGGPHGCLGQHLFFLEAQLIVATVLSRFRFRPRRPGMPATRVAAVLRPREKIEVTLIPRDRAAGSAAA